MPKSISGLRDQQLTLSLPDAATLYDDSSFLISDANAAAWRFVSAWEVSDEPAMIICGPSGAGKTHLAHIVAGHAGGAFAQSEDTLDQLMGLPLVVFDDLPQKDPKAFLTIIGDLTDAGTRLILVGTGHPREWSLGLKDLRTRLEAMARATLEDPDEALISTVIAKGFRDRQILVEPGVIEFAVPRLKLSFEAAHDFVMLADKAALEQKRKITTPLVQGIIEDLSL